MNKKTILFLEPKGTILEVVRAAKARGYRIVAFTTDRDLIFKAPQPYRSAAPLIDQVISINSWEQDILPVAELVNELNPVVGVYAGMDPCAVQCAILRERFGLPTTSPDALRTILNKYELRKTLRKAGLSKIQNYHGRQAGKWKKLGKWPFQGATYFKPVHGFFSAFVQRCENIGDFEAAKKKWQDGVISEPPLIRNYLNSRREFHVEEAFDGELLSVEGISKGGEFESIGLLSRILYSKDPVVEMGSCFPYPHPLETRIVDLVRKAHKALNFTDGPTHTEVIVSKTRRVEIIDFNPRFVGADVLQSINNAYGLKIEEALLDFATGHPVTLKKQANEFSCLQYVLPPTISEFEKIDFPRDPEVKFTTQYHDPGDKITSHDKQIDYLGCYLTVKSSFKEAIEKSRALRSQIKINQNLEGVY